MLVSLRSTPMAVYGLQQLRFDHLSFAIAAFAVFFRLIAFI